MHTLPSVTDLTEHSGSRMQLRELNELAKELHHNGVSIHAISAETGGDEEVNIRSPLPSLL